MRQIRSVLQLKCGFGWRHREITQSQPSSARTERFHSTTPVLGCMAMPWLLYFGVTRSLASRA